jgi:hypothetical protein
MTGNIDVSRFVIETSRGQRPKALDQVKDQNRSEQVSTIHQSRIRIYADSSWRLRSNFFLLRQPRCCTLEAN